MKFEHLQSEIISTFLCVLMFGGMVSFWGCASPNKQTDTFKQAEFRKIMEAQKKKGEVSVKEEIPEKLPEMTVEEHERMGDDCLRQNNIDSSFTHYNKALNLDPNHIRIRYKIGMLYLKKGLPGEAIKEFQEILKKEDRYALAHEGMGNCLLRMGRLDEAQKSFRQALKINTELWQSHNFLGIIYDRQRRFESAITEYQAAIALKPNEGILLNNLGFSYYLKGEYENAVDALTKALKTNSPPVKIYNNLALALGKLGRYQEAMDLFKKMGEEAKALNNIGCVYLGQGKYEEAISSFEKAIELSPNYYIKAAENLEKAKMASSRKGESKIENKKPAVASRKQAVKKQNLAAEKEKPAVASRKQAVKKQNLVADKEKPAVASRKQAVEKQKPAAEKERQEVEKERLEIEKQKPAVASRQPAVDNDNLAVENERLEVEKERLEVERQKPAVASRQPAVENDMPKVVHSDKDASSSLKTETRLEATASKSNRSEHDRTDKVGHYAIKVGSSSSSWKQKSQATLEAEKLKKLGYEAYVKRINAPGKKTSYRVFVGNFQSRQEAQKLAEKLMNEKGVYRALLIVTDNNSAK